MEEIILQQSWLDSDMPLWGVHSHNFSCCVALWERQRLVLPWGARTNQVSAPVGADKTSRISYRTREVSWVGGLNTVFADGSNRKNMFDLKVAIRRGRSSKAFDHKCRFDASKASRRSWLRCRLLLLRGLFVCKCFQVNRLTPRINDSCRQQDLCNKVWPVDHFSHAGCLMSRLLFRPAVCPLQKKYLCRLLPGAQQNGRHTFASCTYKKIA